VPISGDEHRREAVGRAAARWAEELIELDRRNTLLHFRTTRTTTLDLGNADPDAFAALLAGQKKRLTELFRDSSALADAVKRVRTVRRRVRELDEEQGVQAGYLAHGFVEWDVPPSGQASAAVPLRAPLLLYPISVHARTAAQVDFDLEIISDVELNEILIFALHHFLGTGSDVPSNGIALSELTDPDERLRAGFELVDGLARRHGAGLRWEPGAVVGVFSYDKLPMVRDLQASQNLLASHDLIAALAGNEQAQRDVAVAADAPLPDTTPDTIPPAEEFLVHPADASQQGVITAALAGRSLVIKGPPGTGKSQTIANLIAGMAARGKKVLFVAEKRAAIEAVTDRLAQVGLKGLVLDLHDRRLNRKQLAEQLAETLRQAAQEPPQDLRDLHRVLVDRRQRAVAHRHELWAKRDPWGKNIFELQAALLSLPVKCHSEIRFTGNAVQALSADTVRNVEDDIAQLVASAGLRIIRDESPWARSQVRTESEVRDALNRLAMLTAETFDRTRSRLNDLLTRSGLRRPETLDQWRSLLDLIAGVTRTHEVWGPEIFGDVLDKLHTATGNRTWRKANGVRLGFWQRRRLRKQARSMRVGRIRNVAKLHAELGTVCEQLEQWNKFAVEPSLPASVPDVPEIMTDYDDLITELAAIAAAATLDDLDQRSDSDVSEELRRLQDDRETLIRMPDFNERIDRLRGLGQGVLLEEIARRNATPSEAVEIFRWAWLCSIIDDLEISSSHYGNFVGEAHSLVIDEFRKTDAKHISNTSQRVRRLSAERLYQVRRECPEQSQLVRKQADLKRGHLPWRKLVEQAPDVLLAARPCWAMSPLVVSRVLPAKRLFDVVIFDEASQVQPAEAVTSIMRATQVVVAGDNRQLPPTAFFKSVLAGEEDEEYEEDLGAFESILDRLSNLLDERMLTWHYRSADERLIAFSNVKIYDSKLVTFPSALVEPPIEHLLVDGTARPGQGGSSVEEVAAVVDVVLQHAAVRPEESLGVIAMSDKHSKRIEAKINETLRDRRDLDEFFADTDDPTRRFFVKNLERVQGDERDAIVLSVGYAKSADGRLSHNFGPINYEGGERRLNVAVTRAKKRMTVVSSFSHFDVDPSRTSSRGAELLRSYLEYAASGGNVAASTPGTSLGTSVALNPFEEHMLAAMRRADLPVRPQFGVSGYRIDFALAHPDQPGRMVLAVEADGYAYHSSATARDRDRLRQDHLERLGWRFHRVWSTDWFRNPEEQLDRIRTAWKEAVAAVDQGDSAPEMSVPIVAVQPAVVPVRTAPRPPLISGLPITNYTVPDLARLIRWILSDGLLRDDDEIIAEGMSELGFKNRGRRIVEAFTRAIALERRNG
jgi:very-short-patch-repair endonuclease